MHRLGAARAVLSSPEHIQYLTGYRPHPLHAAAVVLDASGCLLIAPNAEPSRHAASHVLLFPAQHLCTLRQDQEDAIALLLAGERREGRLAGEGARARAAYLHASGASGPEEPIDLSPELLRLRRCKDPDELAMIRHAIAATEAMYARAREIIAPGVTELTVYSELQAAATGALGEPPSATGNDYQCNSPGGPPRDRPVREGELYILDLGPAYRGYHADNCRTFAVNREPSPAQQDALAAIRHVFDLVEKTVRPGVRCADLFREAKDTLDEHLPDSFHHHLGHGIGLFPHETPHLNPHWDDCFEEDDVFTVEPGLYDPSLKAGLRVEENYRVTPDGIEKLTRFPTDL